MTVSGGNTIARKYIDIIYNNFCLLLPVIFQVIITFIKATMPHLHKAKIIQFQFNSNNKMICNLWLCPLRPRFVQIENIMLSIKRELKQQ